MCEGANNQTEPDKEGWCHHLLNMSRRIYFSRTFCVKWERMIKKIISKYLCVQVNKKTHQW